MTFAPRTWVVGEVVSATTMNQEIRDQWNSVLDAWTAYTPTFTSSGTAPVLGNGVLGGRYMKVGRTVHLSITLTWGSTTTPGSGNLSFSLPTPAAASLPGVLSATCTTTGSVNFLVGAAPLGNGTSSTGTIWLANPGTIGDWNAWAAGGPTLAAGDIVRVYGTYQSAT
ncbi:MULTISPECIES: hypothetical protein [Streptomyces]|uniref:hypothetical protein n=1 Tax=Streptomyces TaxID=1883 RepID=UPI0004BD7ADA|nr:MULTISPECIES: hypothetical protein [Streptomyces]KOG81231.1 hypothetical protein ADK33_15605 [Streptomyces griseus subsp. rhodochrous]